MVIFTALSTFDVEQTHDKGSALYKYPINSCKNNLERSTNPMIIIQRLMLAVYYYFVYNRAKICRCQFVNLIST
ncbi:hypothetical protein CPS_4257 [Colwellia psychrerythraea 34H]|uniref:Uncharacterized protein n=1 Tax=Colwellia psychrerythraea (strain 34H / ATCC BAA-681) TaxID=167879 RepID=Q47WB5_COLP3|nr:hypothetical protein CPS_4257 [Colwellia psychrerythraea 34H]